MPESAVVAQQERFERDPRDPAAFEALEEHHYLAGQWSELERLYERRLTAELRDGSPTDQARILVRLGQMLERGRNDREGAVRRYQDAAERAPTFRPALLALRRAQAAAGRWELVLQIAEQELATPLPGRARAALHMECGEIWLRHASDREQALCHFRLAVGDDPANPDAASRLARMLESAGQSSEAIVAWEHAIPLLSGLERARARVALARLVELELDDDTRATALYRQATRDDPNHQEALTALTDLAARRGDWDEVRTLQTRRFDLASDPGDQARIAYGAARGRIEHADDPLSALPWLRRALDRRAAQGAVGTPLLLELVVETASAARAKQLVEEAAELYGLAVELDAEHPDALAGLAETRYDLGDVEAATNAVQARLALASNDDDRTLHLAIAAAGLETRGELSEALAGYRQVLAADPEHDAAIAGATRILEEQQEFAEALGLLDAWAERTADPAMRAERQTRAARVARDAGEPESAVMQRLQDALGRDPGLGEAWNLLANVQYELGEDDEALEITRRALTVVRDPGQRARLFTTRGSLLEERGEPRNAANAFAAAAEEAPHDRQPLACALHLLRGLGEWRTAARIVERVAARTPDGRSERRADLFAELGKLRAGPLEDMDGAISAYRLALENEPDRDDAREALEKLLLYRGDDFEPAKPEAEERGERGIRGLLGGLLKNSS